MSERDELRGTVSNVVCNVSFYPERAQPYLLGGNMSGVLDRAADAILAAGYRKPRVLMTRDEANALPDRSAFVTPGEIIFRKWENYWGEGMHGWERELGQVVPAELLSTEGHFPATVLWEPTP